MMRGVFTLLKSRLEFLMITAVQISGTMLTFTLSVAEVIHSFRIGRVITANYHLFRGSRKTGSLLFFRVINIPLIPSDLSWASFKRRKSAPIPARNWYPGLINPLA